MHAGGASAIDGTYSKTEGSKRLGIMQMEKQKVSLHADLLNDLDTHQAAQEE